MSKSESIIKAYVSIARELLCHIEPRNTCITQSRITVETLRRLGVKAEPVTTSLCVECPSLQLAYLAGFTDEERARFKSEASAWVDRYGEEPGSDGVRKEGWRAHLIVLAGGRFLIDSSLDQATMPDRGMPIDRDILVLENVEYKPGRTMIEAGLTTKHGLEINVKYIPKVDARFLTSEAWALSCEMDFIADFIAAEVRERLEIAA